jgi:ribosomal protein S18 acetylase RimI-like enzyme
VILIRPATAVDHNRLWDLLEPVFRAGDTYAVDPRIGRDDAFAYWLHAPRATYVAEVSGEIVGTYYIKTNQPGGGDHVCNCGFIVAPAARGQGVARAMCVHAQDRARDFGYRAMQFNFVLSSNTGAVRLWRRLGFAIVGTIPAAFRHPALGFVDAYVMHKTL